MAVIDLKFPGFKIILFDFEMKLNMIDLYFIIDHKQKFKSVKE